MWCSGFSGELQVMRRHLPISGCVAVSAATRRNRSGGSREALRGIRGVAGAMRWRLEVRENSPLIFPGGPPREFLKLHRLRLRSSKHG